MNARNVVALSLLVAVAASQASCGIQGYCIDCTDADTSNIDASTIDADVDIDAPLWDAGPLPDACVPSGVEVCDDIDNDCNGEVDDGELAGVGAVCSSNVGECAEGVTECVEGVIVCGGGGILPTLELCDTLDNDCNGLDDDGNPEGGAFCGTDLGECVSGVTQCNVVTGEVECQGNYDGTAELCNGRDDDCDNEFDEDLGTNGPCGPSEGDEGECTLGAYQCLGGEWQCVGADYPTLEQCDAADHDCDGNALNGYDFPNDARNCGPAGNVASCGNVCVDNFTVATPHVIAVQCVVGACEIALCELGYWDQNNTYADGCEYPCTYQSETDICNLNDDDCDGDIDEDASAPVDFCDVDGECAGVTPTCTADGWLCDYDAHTGDVSTDGDNRIIPEADCDGKDNDCDGVIDDAFPGWGTLCYDDGDGICRRSGSFICNGTGDGLACDITSPPVTPGTESCNNLDDNCDGIVDNGYATGALHDWIDIGGGVEMFAYEATRPDASTTSTGGLDTYPCSRASALPWTNITHPDAETACAAVGARLCSEDEWQRACEVVGPTPVPAPQGSGPNFEVFIEAEDFTANTPAADNEWIEISAAAASAGKAMHSRPDSGTTIEENNPSPHLEYSVNFTQTGTHYVWLRVWANSSDDDSAHVGINGVVPNTGDDFDTDILDQWAWVSAADSDNNFTATINVPSAGVHTFDIWMRQDGLAVDAIILSTNGSYTPSGVSTIPRCDFSYATNCNTYAANTCNGNDYDYDLGTIGDQDGMLPGGALTTCYANWGASDHIYDLSGNIKEWTAERSGDVNPIRGGAYNSPAYGTSCGNDFTVADDSFFFPNVGFRCCR